MYIDRTGSQENILPWSYIDSSWLDVATATHDNVPLQASLQTILFKRFVNLVGVVFFLWKPESPLIARVELKHK